LLPEATSCSVPAVPFGNAVVPFEPLIGLALLARLVAVQSGQYYALPQTVHVEWFPLSVCEDRPSFHHSGYRILANVPHALRA
jgi:hypothetical protein